ncbi:MAG: carboxypeptidase-like regulatory domain-containing protein [Gemmatimonadota bacterium]|nr:carboxypeptidase-like regulatory domain-containing protein [Gemmatimonadota bacterium]
MPQCAALAGTFRRAITVCAIAAAVPGALGAQQGGGFYGTVMDSLRAPLAGVEVRVLEASRAARTDSAGRFALGGIPAGVYHVVFRRLEYRSITGTVRLADGDSIDLRFYMGRMSAELDTVRVRASGTGPMAEFERRRATGLGTFITREALAHMGTQPLADVIAAKATRVRLVALPGGGWTLAAAHPSTCMAPSCPQVPLCFMTLWVDRVRVYTADSGDPPPDLSEYKVDDIEAIEVYPGAAETPLELNPTGASCGTIVLWTRPGGASGGQPPGV